MSPLLTLYSLLIPVSIYPHGTSKIHIAPVEIFEMLLSNLVGNSSRIFVWNLGLEKFEMSEAYRDKTILLRGFSEEMSKR